MKPRLLIFAVWVALPRIASAQPIAERLIGDGAENRVDVVILGEGYTAAQQALLRADIGAIATEAFGQTPFLEYSAFFNVYVVPLVSNEAGADHPSRNLYVDTALDAAFDCIGVSRFICVDWTEAQNVALSAVPDYDILAVVVNDPEFGGVTGFNITVISTNVDAREVMIHELGHTVGFLADEYDDPNPSIAPCDPVADCAAPNVTTRTQRADVKWNTWIDPMTPVPTQENAGHGSVVGLFEGGRYQATGVYRPTEAACRMHFLDEPYCPVCAEGLIGNGVYRLASALEGAVPTSTSAAVPLAGRATFEVTHLQTSPPTIGTLWLVDGSTISTGTTSVTIAGLDLGTGPHRLDAEIRDATLLVRNRARWPLLEVVSWTIEVGPDVCGDRLVSGPEVCDDGVNDGAYDGCRSDCAALADFCGDGITNGPEACDDGDNDGAYDHCTPGCGPKAAYCGDGALNGPEVCDDGVNDGSYDRCGVGCGPVLSFCGDGTLNGPEACDDGVNDGTYDRCGVGCGPVLASCGDATVNGPEVCDDGINDGAYDRCGTGCTAKTAFCGDGTKNGPEACDGAGEGGRACLPSCALAAMMSDAPDPVAEAAAGCGCASSQGPDSLEAVLIAVALFWCRPRRA